MEVVIVGRTQMRSHVCIGALSLENWSSLRLLPPSGEHGWPQDTAFAVGDKWEVKGNRVQDLVPPHVENFLVSDQLLQGDYGPNLRQDIEANCPVARGDFPTLYGGFLEAIASGSICIRRPNVPDWSTQFWCPPWDLRCDGSYYHIGQYRMRYVGLAPAIPVIPANSLVRVSLARWFTPTGHTEEACYLQLSGWWL